MRIVRLGEGVDRTGWLSAAALDRTMTALRGIRWADRRRERRPPLRWSRPVRTRDAANSQEFAGQGSLTSSALRLRSSPATRKPGCPSPGATRELAGTPLADECPPPYLVTDIGGGSTEFVLGGPNEAADRRQVSRGQIRGCSVNIGCVRLTERHLHGDPPLPAEIAATIKDIDAALGEAAAAVPAEQAKTLVGLAGSVTTVAAIALGLDEYDSARTHHSRISAARVHETADALLAMTRAERAAIPVMHPGRVDVIGAGALILDRIMTRFGFTDVLVSGADVLDGIAWSLIPWRRAGPSPWHQIASDLGDEQQNTVAADAGKMSTLAPAQLTSHN